MCITSSVICYVICVYRLCCVAHVFATLRQLCVMLRVCIVHVVLHMSLRHCDSCVLCVVCLPFGCNVILQIDFHGIDCAPSGIHSRRRVCSVCDRDAASLHLFAV